jgi:hypothetical protein
MALRHSLVAWAFLAYCSFSYSETISGTTSNAAGNGLTWSMGNVLPAATGLTVDGVIYQYSAVKNPIDSMIVNIQNKDTIQPGFIFRSQDDWSGLRGNTITKVIPVDNIPITRWGAGSITVDGIGEVTNPSVVYKYKYDTCADPLSSPICPGYAAAMAKQLTEKPAEIYDPLSDQNVRNVLDARFTNEEESKISTSSFTRKTDKTIDRKSVDSPLSREDAIRASQLEMLNNIPGIESYKVSIPGGVYNDVLRYPDKKLPDSKDARRLGFAQENLHKAMVDLQYKQ